MPTDVFASSIHRTPRTGADRSLCKAVLVRKCKVPVAWSGGWGRGGHVPLLPTFPLPRLPGKTDQRFSVKLPPPPLSSSKTHTPSAPSSYPFPLYISVIKVYCTVVFMNSHSSCQSAGYRQDRVPSADKVTGDKRTTGEITCVFVALPHRARPRETSGHRAGRQCVDRTPEVIWYTHQDAPSHCCL